MGKMILTNSKYREYNECTPLLDMTTRRFNFPGVKFEYPEVFLHG